jgi:hypothetical protein
MFLELRSKIVPAFNPLCIETCTVLVQLSSFRASSFNPLCIETCQTLFHSVHTTGSFNPLCIETSDTTMHITMLPTSLSILFALRLGEEKPKLPTWHGAFNPLCIETPIERDMELRWVSLSILFALRHAQLFGEGAREVTLSILFALRHPSTSIAWGRT